MSKEKKRKSIKAQKKLSLKDRILREMCVGTMNEEERIVYELLKEEPKLIAFYGYEKADKEIRRLYHKFKGRK